MSLSAGAQAMQGNEVQMLEVIALDHAFGPRDVLAGIDLYVPPGRCVALVGPSGCGKTTLLHLCAGLIEVQTGQLRNGFTRTATVFQQPLLLPWLTTLDNIALGLKAKGLARAERRQRAADMAQAVGLDALALRQFPHQLSGGMQSRAALARALVLAPEMLLLDEPFAALDIGLKAHMHQLLQTQRRARDLAVLMITHDAMEAVALADSVLVMAAQPGRIVWRLDIECPTDQRSDVWVYEQTAVLLSEPVVRQAFDLPAPPVLAQKQTMSVDGRTGVPVIAHLSRRAGKQC